MMKTKLIVTLTTVAILTGCGRNTKFRIEAELDGADKRMAYLEEVTIDKVVKVDSTEFNSDNTVRFKGNVEHASFYQISVGNKTISLLVEPGEMIKIEGDYNRLPLGYDVDGSNGSAMLMALNQEMYRTKKSLDSLEKVYDKLQEEGGSPERIDEISNEYQDLINKQRRFNTNFILNFPSSLASLYALYQQIDQNTFLFNRSRDIQFYKILSDSLKKYHPQSKHVHALQNNTKALLENLQRQKALSMMDTISPSLPDIKLPNPEGDTIALSSLKGKIVLLSYWASWNPESVAFNLQLKPIYKKYKNRGFEVYQVSLDNSKEAWTRAIRFDELAWFNVCGLDYPKSEAALSYNVQALPTSYLLDKQQEDILGKNMSAHELDRKLNQLLNN